MLNFLMNINTAGALEGATGGSQQTGAAAAGGSMLGSFLPLILMVVVFYFLLMRPQKKREKQTQAMQNSLDIGDEIVTSGGIIGRVVSIHDESLLIETGSANTKLRILRGAVQQNTSNKERQAAAAAQAAQEKAVEPKKKGLFGKKKIEEVEA